MQISLLQSSPFKSFTDLHKQTYLESYILRYINSYLYFFFKMRNFLISKICVCNIICYWFTLCLFFVSDSFIFRFILKSLFPHVPSYGWNGNQKLLNIIHYNGFKSRQRSRTWTKEIPESLKLLFIAHVCLMSCIVFQKFFEKKYFLYFLSSCPCNNELLPTSNDS